MKILEEIVEPKLIEKIKESNLTAKITPSNLDPDTYLFMTWSHRIPKGWYGFALGQDVPMAWAIAIDKVLKLLEKETPNFEIHQIKLKFGGLRFYVDLKLHECEMKTELLKIISDLEDLLFSNNLIY